MICKPGKAKPPPGTLQGSLHLKHPVYIALPLALLFNHFRAKGMIFKPIFRQRQRQFLIVCHQRNGRKQIVTTAAGKQNCQTQQAAQMLGHAWRYGVLLVE